MTMLTDQVLGKDDEEINVDSMEDYRDIVHAMMEQAKHQIDIITPDLEPAIFDTLKAEQAIFRLSKRHPNTRTRILVKDSMRSVQNGHRLIRLAQQLTSSVFIHRPSSKHIDSQSACIIVDQTGFVFRTIASERNYKATANFKSPRMAAKRQDQFDEIWEHSSPDMQTRRLYV